MARIWIDEHDASVRRAIGAALDGTGNESVNRDADPAGAHLAIAREARTDLPTVVVVDDPTYVNTVRALATGAIDVVSSQAHESEWRAVLHSAIAGDGFDQPVALFGDASLPIVEQLAAKIRENKAILLAAEKDTGAGAITRLAFALAGKSGSPVAFSKLEPGWMDALASSSPALVYLEGIESADRTVQAALLKLVRDSERPYPLVIVTAEDLRGSAEIDTTLSEVLLSEFLEVPPLRERLADLPEMVRFLATDGARRLGRRVNVPPNAIAAMHAYRWPGNLRELGQMVRTFAIDPEGEGTAAAGAVNTAYRVPVYREAVALRLADGSVREVTIFRSDGQLIESIIEGTEPFVPVDDGGTFRLYSRSAIAAISFPTSRIVVRPESIIPGKKVRATVRLRSGIVLEGELSFSAEKSRSRAADYLNEDTRSFTLRVGSDTHHIAKAQVEFVEEKR